ncbi:MAG TPA: MFS transporter [Jiangellaceae bacterium]
MRPLSVPAFRRMVVAWTFSNFGDSLLYLTLAMWAKDLTGSNSAAGLVFLALGLPVFLAPFAGYVADRMSRRRLVVIANLAAAVGVLSLLSVRTASDLWLIYVVTFGYGLLGYATSAAQSGLVRDLLPDDLLAGANGMLTTIDQGLRILTPLVGAGLYAAVGGWAVAVATSVLLVVASAAMLAVRVAETPPTAKGEREGFWREFSAGAAHLRRSPVLAQLTVLMAVVFLLTGFMNTALFAAIEEGFELGTEFFGVLASIQGGGAILGGITAPAVIRAVGEQRTIALAFGGLALGALVMTTGVVPLAVAGAVATGVAVPWMVVGFVTYRQKHTPAQLQGRVSAATTMALNGPQTVGTATGAALIAVLDYRVLIAAEVVGIAVCALILVLRPSRTRADATEPPNRLVGEGEGIAVEPVH